jgi:2-oxoglutarate dehydrogenase complex dehydrogenase (E1) component-like enzyme
MVYRERIQVAAERFDELNLGYVRDLLDRYLDSPESVDPVWREIFESGANGFADGHPVVQRLRELFPEHARNGRGTLETPTPPPAEAPFDDELLAGVAAAMALVKAHRTHGHLAASLDPLGAAPAGDPSLSPENLIPPLTHELQERIPAHVLRIAVPGETLADALPRLRETYCGTLAYQIEHISSHEQRVWLRHAIESGTYRKRLPDERRRRLAERLVEVEAFERFLRRAFLGQKQFSIEGLDLLVPMLDETLELAAAAGAQYVALGTAHRGRLNILAHVLRRPYEQILREFEGERALDAVTHHSEEGTGDVKYHHGARSVIETETGELTVVLAANPSHLEAVDPVAVGLTRAAQTDHATKTAEHDPGRAVAVLVHGDAAFPGQGVVAETLNLQNLRGYTTGGTLHIVANNQVGFTTDPMDSRSTRYSSDLAKGFDLPIVHVNADDPEAAIAAIRLAMAYRERFHNDVVVDLVGYRRLGHNEQDEAGYTQPLMVKAIEAHPPVASLYTAELRAAGVIDDGHAERLRGRGPPQARA